MRPRLDAVCDTNPEALAWFERIEHGADADRRPPRGSSTTRRSTCSTSRVPHHLHEQLYLDAIAAGKDFLGEKPFGIDLAAARRIVAALEAQPGVFARCSSEMPYFPGAQLAFEHDPLGRARRAHRGPARVPALERPRPRASRSTGSARRASAARSA